MEQKTFKGGSVAKSELTPYNVGLMRLSEANICKRNFTDNEIAYIGKCSIKRKKIVLGRIGNNWAIGGYVTDRFTPASYQIFRAHYIIVGKKVTNLHPAHNMAAEKSMDWFEARDTSKPVHQMTVDEIFADGKATRPKRCKASKTPARQQAQYCKAHGQIAVTDKDAVRAKTSIERIKQYHQTFKKSYYEA